MFNKLKSYFDFLALPGEPVPPTIKIEVQQRGLATGQIVIVRRGNARG